MRGSRAMISRHYENGGWRTAVTSDLRDRLAETFSAYLATVSADGQPYIQHRGGPAGFIKVLDDKTLGIADFAGNQQFISAGNLADNAKAHLFLMDYARKRRVKIWGQARMVEDDPALLAHLSTRDYRGRPERALIFKIDVWDTNCPQHIPHLLPADQVNTALAQRDASIAALQKEVAELRQRQSYNKGRTDP